MDLITELGPMSFSKPFISTNVIQGISFPGEGFVGSTKNCLPDIGQRFFRWYILPLSIVATIVVLWIYMEADSCLVYNKSIIGEEYNYFIQNFFADEITLRFTSLIRESSNHLISLTPTLAFFFLSFFFFPLFFFSFFIIEWLNLGNDTLQKISRILGHSFGFKSLYLIALCTILIRQRFSELVS